MIDYGYFRHRFDAHENAKLNELVDEIGVVGFGYYYTLLELYGRKIAASKNKESVTIHMRVIANVWRKRIDSCNKVLTKLQLSDLLVVTFSNSTCTLSIPNFLKYYGSYGKYAPHKTSNKIKENKIKESSSGTPHQEWINDYGQERVDAAILKAEKWAVGKKVSDWKKLTEKFLVEDFTPVPKLEKELEELFEQ